MPPLPYSGLSGNVAETATHIEENAVLSKKVFAGNVKLLLPNRYYDIEEEEEAEEEEENNHAVDEVEICVNGGYILLTIQQEIVEMGASAGKHQHSDKLLFEGLQRHKDQTWGVNIC